MIKQRNLLIVLSVLLCPSIDITAQLRYSSRANSSTTTTYASNLQLASSGDNVFITYKRGRGTALADREIKIARSTNSGRSFAESDITFANNADTYSPIIATTTTSVVVLYSYDTIGTSSSRTCIARSTNGGVSFNLVSNSTAFVESEYSDRLVSDGISKYFVCDFNEIFASLDDGVTFSQVNTPPDFSDTYVTASLAATSTYLWVVFVQDRSDTIFVYRSSDNGTSYQLITQHFADLPDYGRAFACEALGNQLNIAWIHEEVGIYSLRFRRITETSAGSIQDIDSSTYYHYSYDPISVRNTQNTVWVKAGDKIYHSINGAPWSRGSQVATEVNDYSLEYSFIAHDDTTLFLSLNGFSTGSLTEYLFANVKWTDVPVSSLPSDTLIGGREIYWNLRPYVETPDYRLQLSLTSDFVALELDTISSSSSFNIPMLGRFTGNGTRYYYRARGEDISYSTTWSSTQSFRYGSVITTAPTQLSPSNGSSFLYPQIVPFAWSAVPEATDYNLHVSSSDAFSDTVWFRGVWLTSTNISLGMPQNGTLYWRVRGAEDGSGSTGPWSSTGHFNYSGLPTGVIVDPNLVPIQFDLHQNFPNPFNPSTHLRYEIPAHVVVSVSIFNSVGQLITTLIEATHSPGYYSLDFDASHMASGIYFCRMLAGNYSKTIKLIVTK